MWVDARPQSAESFALSFKTKIYAIQKWCMMKKGCMY